VGILQELFVRWATLKYWCNNKVLFVWKQIFTNLKRDLCRWAHRTFDLFRLPNTIFLANSGVKREGANGGRPQASLEGGHPKEWNYKN